MRLTVGELIEKLQQCDPDARVMNYVRVGEDADWAHGVLESDSHDFEVERDDDYREGRKTNKADEERPYIKGDWPDRPYKSKLGDLGPPYQHIGKVVIII